MRLPIDLLQALMKENLYKSSTFLFVNQCAPVAYDLKPAELMMIDRKKVQEYEMQTLQIGKKSSTLYEGAQKSAVLVYNEDAIKELLNENEVHQFLYDCHYASDGLEEILKLLGQNIQSYFEGKQQYPHELGVLLGYPMKDVIGYIKNRGKNYLYCGYWKVYADLEKAKRQFEQYNRARYLMISHLLK